MNNVEEKIKKDLLTLPIFMPDKILIWSVYKKLKPAADVWMDYEKFRRLKKLLGIESRDTQKIGKLFTNMNLHYKTIKQNLENDHKVFPYSSHQPYDSIGFLISYKKDLVDRLYKILSSDSNNKNNVHLELGELYGFPKTAIEAYSKYADSAEKFFSVFVREYDNKSKFKNEYWYPYTGYKVRKGFEYEDSKIGKKWADTLRREMPELAKEFEEKAKRYTHK